MKRVQNLADSGRLQEVLGDEGADDLLQQVYDSAKAAKSRATKIRVGKYAAGVAGLGAAERGISAALSGSK